MTRRRAVSVHASDEVWARRGLLLLALSSATIILLAQTIFAALTAMVGALIIATSARFTRGEKIAAFLGFAIAMVSWLRPVVETCVTTSGVDADGREVDPSSSCSAPTAFHNLDQWLTPMALAFALVPAVIAFVLRAKERSRAAEPHGTR